MKFDDISIYDAELADQGQWFAIKKIKGFEALLRYVDGMTQKGELEFKRAKMPYAKGFRTGKLDELDSAIIMLVHVWMKDWKGVTSNGKPVPYSPQVAREFFSQDANKWLVLELLQLANDPENFVSDEVDPEAITRIETDEATKN